MAATVTAAEASLPGATLSHTGGAGASQLPLLVITIKRIFSQSATLCGGRGEGKVLGGSVSHQARGGHCAN